LSKRSDLNAALAHYNNENLAQIAPGGNGYIGGVTASAGVDSSAVQLGIRHHFWRALWCHAMAPPGAIFVCDFGPIYRIP
jgi:hypothetical protein